MTTTAMPLTIDSLRASIERFERDIAYRKGQRDAMEKGLGAETAENSKTADEVVAEEFVQQLLAKATALSWTRAKGTIEGLVIRALRSIFRDRSYGFTLEQETKRGVSCINFVLDDNGVEIDPWKDGGVGVSDVIGFALRIAYVVLYRPKVRPLLIIDEPFKHLAQQYRPNASRFVKQVSKELGLQIIVVTHDPVMSEEADQIIRFAKVNGKCVTTDETVMGNAEGKEAVEG